MKIGPLVWLSGHRQSPWVRVVKSDTHGPAPFGCCSFPVPLRVEDWVGSNAWYVQIPPGGPDQTVRDPGLRQSLLDPRRFPTNQRTLSGPDQTFSETWSQRRTCMVGSGPVRVVEFINDRRQNLVGPVPNSTTLNTQKALSSVYPLWTNITFTAVLRSTQPSTSVAR